MMERNVTVVFEHLDTDGDEVRITTTRRGRLTVGVREGGVGCRAYLSRDAATMLRQALDGWLSETEPVRREHWCGHGDDHPRHPHTANGEALECPGVRAETYGPEEPEATETEACVAAPEESLAPYRLEALRLAVQYTEGNASSGAVLRLAEEFVWYLATGETPEPAPVVVPRDMAIVQSAVSAPCGLCQHMTHGAGRCTEGGRGLHRCKCGEALSAGTCGVCQHLFHGTAICADGAKGTGPRCECRGRAEDYQR